MPETRNKLINQSGGIKCTEFYKITPEKYSGRRGTTLYIFFVLLMKNARDSPEGIVNNYA